MPRLFIAIDLPDEHKATLARLQVPTLAVRWTPPVQYHLTLRFIGAVDGEMQAEIEKALASIHEPPFSLEGYNFGVFPSLRRPRVVFVGISPTPALMRLHQAINHALGQIGLAPNDKLFRPHITLARVKTASVLELRMLLRTHQSFTLAPFLVSQFHVYESILRPEGALHVQRRTFDLVEA